jgi:hypothetical protein
MSGDSPIEFRAASPGLAVADWIAERTRREASVYTGSAVVLLVCAVLAVLATYGFAFAVLVALNAMTCGVWRSIVALLAFALVAGLFALQRRVDGDDLEPVKVDAGSRGTITLRLSRLTGSSWLMFLDHPSADYNPVVRVALNLMLLAPRLASLSGRMWSLSQRMKSIDAAAVGAGLDTLIQSGGRINIGDLLQDLPNADPQRFITDMTMIDGVVLLTSEPPGLTLVPSLAEEFEAWKKAARKKRRRSDH